MSIDNWTCCHDPKCVVIGVRCEPPDVYDYQYEIGYWADGEPNVEKTRDLGAALALRAYEDGFREGQLQARTVAFEETILVAEIPVLRNEPHRIVRNIRAVAAMTPEISANLRNK